MQALEKNTDPVIKDLLLDSIQLLAQVNMDINNDRREKIRPEMGKCKMLANRERPTSAFLFGDNLEQEYKTVDSSNKISEAMNSQPKRKQNADEYPKQFKRFKIDPQKLRQKMQNFRSRGGRGSSQHQRGGHQRGGHRRQDYQNNVYRDQPRQVKHRGQGKRHRQ